MNPRRWCPAVGLAMAAVLLTTPAATAHVEPGAARGAAAPRTTRVVVITLDAFGSYVARRLGPDRAPVLHRMLAHGAGTLEARTAREQTATLPNHTTVVTGRRITSGSGHRVTWNDERLDPATVQEAAGHPVASIFSQVRADGGRPALFTSKQKLSLFDRSWPKGVARLVVEPDNDRLTRMARRDLLRHGRPLTFLHLSLPDEAGHAHGFSSRAYLRAAHHADRLVGTVLRTIRSQRRLRRHTTVVVTADHGGKGAGHYDPTVPADYRIPFVAWGVGVADGADLYDLNPDHRDPGRRRTRYGAARQPVRNGDAANVAVRLLGLAAVPGSRFGRDAVLDLR